MKNQFLFKLEPSACSEKYHLRVPAGYVVLRKRKLFTEFVRDDEGQRCPKDHVGECEVEDEDVPCSPHVLLPHYSAENKQVAQN